MTTQKFWFSEAKNFGEIRTGHPNGADKCRIKIGAFRQELDITRKRYKIYA